MTDIIQIINTAYGDARLQDDQDIMSYPHYTLSKNKVTATKTTFGIDSEGNRFMVQIFPSAEFGMMTIYDHDFVLYFTSHLAQALQDGLAPSNIIRAHRHHILKSIGRKTGGGDYKDLEAALTRLQTTTIRNTKLKYANGKMNGYKQFSIIDKVRYIRETGEYEVHVCEWIYDSIIEKQLLSLSPRYFKISSALERRLYLIFRKHAGNQKHGYWISFDHLYKKSGTDDNERKFKSRVKIFIEKKNNLPEYFLIFEKNLDGFDGVSAIKRDFLELDHPGREILPLKRGRISANIKSLE